MPPNYDLAAPGTISDRTVPPGRPAARTNPGGRVTGGRAEAGLCIRPYTSAVPHPDPLPAGVALLIPVKAFSEAKSRLADVLDPTQRARLAREMATIVVRAAAGMPVYVVCDDRTVAAWAAGAGAEVLWRPGRGLNPAVSEGVAALRERGFRRAVVAHSDLPLAERLDRIGAFDGVTIVPDRRDDGTNAIAVPTDAGFRFAYGPGSFRRHGAEARRLGLTLRVVRHARLGLDVDLPGDLAEARASVGDLARPEPGHPGTGPAPSA